MILVPLIVGAGAIAYYVRQRGIIEDAEKSRPAVQPSYTLPIPAEVGAELVFDEYSRPTPTGDEIGATPFRTFIAKISDALEIEGPRPVQSNLVTGEPVFSHQAMPAAPARAVPDLGSRLRALVGMGRF